MQDRGVIVLVNLNRYLGGGETLMVRFAEYLKKQQIDFFCVCAEGGYANLDLQRKGIESISIIPISISPDYFYGSNIVREKLDNILSAKIGNRTVRFVSFCMRDLYLVFGMSKKLERVAIIHSILHIEDDLYAGQKIFEKIWYQVTEKRRFSNLHAINFNRKLLSIINENNGLICMAELIAEKWRQNFEIMIPSSNIVPLPSFTQVEKITKKNDNRKIIWVGRLVDFKIPAIIAMIDFLASNDRYTLTIVGDGDRTKILQSISKNNISPERVIFMGEIKYSELKNVISEHSIGYAMGTSLVELAKFKMPVIVALASYSHALFSRPICGGCFFNQPKGCDGSELAIVSEDEINITIEGVMGEIESNWEGVADACYLYARNNYSAKNNFNAYVKIIENTSLITSEDKKIQIIQANFTRKVLHNLIKRWGK